MATPVSHTLEQVGRKVVRWRTGLVATRGAAALLGALLVFGLLDFWLRLGRADRFVTWSLLVLLAVATLWVLRRTLARRFTGEGVAAMIERRFPQLDNHLINYLQFSRDPAGDPFKLAYVRTGAPAVQTLDLRRLRDARAHRRSWLLLAGVVAALALPAAFVGKAWGVALYRTVNPFSAMPPLTLTRIVEVKPGAATVPQGEPVVLSCTVRGFRGHEVRIEVDPGDADPTTWALGAISTDADQSFSHRVPKVATRMRYRFRAGDAPDTDWFEIATRPPPAFTGIRLALTPPAYTRRAPATIDPRSQPVAVAAGSALDATVTSNTPMQSVALQLAGDQTAELAAATAGATSWRGSAVISGGSSLRLVAVDTCGTRLEEDIPLTLEPDRAPAIEILSPAGRTILPPGQRPRIQFGVADDYGLAEVRIEEVAPDSPPDAQGTVVKRWEPGGDPVFEFQWSSDLPLLRGRDLAFRIVATDQFPGEPHRSVSAPVVFTLPTLADAARQNSQFEQQAFTGLQQLIDLQKQNLTDTEAHSLGKALDDATAAQWQALADRQHRVRELTRALLANPLKPFGGMAAKVKELYVHEMVLAIDSLRAIPAAAAELKRRHAKEALALQHKILDQLTRAEASFVQGRIDRQVAGIAAMLESLIRGQAEALKQTKDFVASKAEVGAVLVDAQDALAADLTALLTSCREEANSVRGNDPAFATTLEQIAARAGDLRIREDMVLAAERLDENQPAEAAPLEERALANLKSLRAMIDQVRLGNEAEKRELLLKAVAQAKEKLERIKQAYQRELAVMDEIRGTADKNDELVDQMEEAYEELVRKTNEELLQIPTDLHVFTDLNVANDIVEDVFSVFQEVEQKMEDDDAADTAGDDPDEVLDLGFAKEDVQLAMMEEAQERIDDVETWLSDKADAEKVTTEGFDREEMPESGIATGQLATEVEDMIGDLLEEEEDQEDLANNGATTHAMPDMEMGWEVQEGDIASYAAKGRSGNETPDHHEQDGRSNVGRQGMASGETAAGSGTISEGDKNIEARRTEDPTQSGQIDLEGEADTKATGGGKLATGKADDKGMSGGSERMDSNEQGSSDGMAALMARQAEAIYAKASLKNVRVDDLRRAAHHLRQSGDAIAKGDPQQLREHRRMAVSSLRRAQARLEAGPAGAIEADPAAGVLDDVIESGPDHAPPEYRDKVADYYKALNEAM